MKTKDEELSHKVRRKLRTPSSVRDDVAVLRSKIVDLKQTFGAINDNPRTIVPDAIEALVTQNQYIDMQSLAKQEEATNLNTANAIVQALAPRFLEGIARSSEGSYIFITKVEVYMRASPSIDDCANSTITLGYSEQLLFVSEQKREFKNQWYEVKIYHGKFEYLVIGCLHVKVNSTEVQAVLEASLGKASINDSYWRMYVPSTNVPNVQDVRLLRNFTNMASGYKWYYKSKRLYDHDFTSASAINIQSGDIAAAGSLLIRMKAEKIEMKR